MATFELTTQGIEVGYGDDGFFAFGTSVIHNFQNEDWQHGTPPIRGMPVTWRIGLNEEDPFEKYVTYTYPASDLSPRVPLLRDYFLNVKQTAKVEMRRWDHSEPISLHCIFPNDPSLASLVMGAASADRELVIWSQGWIFLVEEKLAPAVTVDGFMERKEPAFSLDPPMLRLK